MGSDGNPSDAVGDPPKKKGFDLSLFLGPTTDVQTSIGKVYLYPPRVSDYTSFEKLSASEPTARFREFLPRVASLSTTTKIEKERESLASDLIAQLADDEVETIAEAYASSSALKGAREGSKDRSGLPREDAETSTAYLDRLLKKELEDQVEGMQRMRKQMLASTSSIFDQVRKSSSVLGSTLTDYERVSRTIATPAIETKHLEFSNHMAEHHARLGRERAEELEMVRLTGQMTAQSATTLRDLAEAATVLLERLDERDQKSDLDTRKQLRIAVGSVIVSAILALIALVYSGASYYQDKANNSAGDKWQEKMLSSLSESNQKRNAAEAENQLIKTRVEELAAVISRFSPKQSSQPADALVRSATSTDRRATSPGKTAPAP